MADGALKNNLCPVLDALKTVLKVRRAPSKYQNNKQALDYAETLVYPIQRFVDVLEDERKGLNIIVKVYNDILNMLCQEVM